VGLSDLWALGNCIYQFLTGVVPFKAASAYLIFMRAKVRTQGF
jgi:serine/threonine protein kinase